MAITERVHNRDDPPPAPVASPLVNPFNALTALTTEALGAVRMLARAARHVEQIAESTRALLPMREAIGDVAGDTRALALLREDMARVADYTSKLDAMLASTDVLPGMDGRMAHIEEAMPVLVEVQRSLSRLPDTMERLPETMDRLGAGLTDLSELLERLVASVEQLDENVTTLHGAVEPLGRVAQRIPGSRR